MCVYVCLYVYIYTCILATYVCIDVYMYISFIPVPPSVMPEPSSGKVVVRKDTTVTLECKANGNPSPVVTWYVL